MPRAEHTDNDEMLADVRSGGFWQGAKWDQGDATRNLYSSICCFANLNVNQECLHNVVSIWLLVRNKQEKKPQNGFFISLQSPHTSDISNSLNLQYTISDIISQFSFFSLFTVLASRDFWFSLLQRIFCLMIRLQTCKQISFNNHFLAFTYFNFIFLLSIFFFSCLSYYFLVQFYNDMKEKSKHDFSYSDKSACKSYKDAF